MNLIHNLGDNTMGKKVIVGTRVSEIESGLLSENSLIFFSDRKNSESGEYTTGKATPVQLRHILNFDNEFKTVDDALAVTFDGDHFYVYTDSSKGYVSHYVNGKGTAQIVTGIDGNPAKYPTGRKFNDFLALFNPENELKMASIFAYESDEVFVSSILPNTVYKVDLSKFFTFNSRIDLSKSHVSVTVAAEGLSDAVLFDHYYDLTDGKYYLRFRNLGTTKVERTKLPVKVLITQFI